MEEAIMMLARIVNTQKGESLGLSALLLGILGSMEHDQREKALSIFEGEITTLRRVIASSDTENEVCQGIDVFVDAILKRAREL